jgi:ribosome-associated toxin RatA of RatAB toxin-antitoxin module
MATMTQSIIIPASKEKVWAKLADLGGVVQYHPFVSNSYYYTSDQEGIGAGRVCEFPNGMKIKETASQWQPGEEYTLNITFEEGPTPPMRNVQATLNVQEVENGTKVQIVMSYDMRFGFVGELMNQMMIRKQYGNMIDGMLKGLKHNVTTGENMDIQVLKRISPVPA